MTVSTLHTTFLNTGRSFLKSTEYSSGFVWYYTQLDTCTWSALVDSHWVVHEKAKRKKKLDVYYLNMRSHASSLYDAWRLVIIEGRQICTSLKSSFRHGWQMILKTLLDFILVMKFEPVVNFMKEAFSN